MSMQAELASRIAVRQARVQDQLAAESYTRTDKTSHKTVGGQLLRAAAEIQKGNYPLSVESDDNHRLYLVESRSTFIGKIVEIAIGQGALDFVHTVIMTTLENFLRGIKTGEFQGVFDMTLKFLVTGGDTYLVDLTSMTCTCEKGGNCTHYAQADCWNEAGLELHRDLPEPKPEVSPEIQSIINGYD